MIYITGDCHSDFTKFNTKNFTEQKSLTKDDYVIICGDFGGIFYHESSDYTKKENYWLDWLEDKSFTTLFVDGNHENFNRLYSFPVEEWHGGKVHVIRPSVLHLMRGEVFDIDGKKVFAFGGASSHDIQDGIIDPANFKSKDELSVEIIRLQYQEKMFRVKDWTWWEQELPTQAEMDNGVKNLKKMRNKVDFIVSHCAPQNVASVFSHGIYKQDVLTTYFNQIADTTKFEKWFFGHYHDDRQVMEKYIMLYDQIVRIN